MKWKSVKGYKGIRYREHEIRKHGLKKDRYFSIRYQLNGRQVEEGIGWESEGWTLDKVAFQLAKLKEARRIGEGPQTLREKREIEDQKREIKKVEKEKAKQEAITFNEFYNESYLPLLETNKAPGSVHAEKILFAKWIKPYIGNIPFKDMESFHIEKIKKAMLDAGKAGRSIEYMLSIIRQIWNQAIRDKLINKVSPTKQVKKPKFDNKRTAFFTHEQADLLLEKLKEKSTQIYHISLLSLHSGMRASEIFNLKWADVNMEEGIILIQDAKGGSRPGFMTSEVKAMFVSIMEENIYPDDRIFNGNTGEKIKQISKTFERTLEEMGINKGIKDKRQRLTFHTLRHTYASWQVMDGTPLYTVQQLLGHKSITLTERYAHLAPDNLRAAVNSFEKKILKERKAREKKIVDINIKPVKG